MNTFSSVSAKKGFTLVEIMIVVVIIGLLAAMAIPAFQRIRENSIRSTMDNDARQLASAAQQYFLEEGETEVTHGYNPDTGAIAAPLNEYVRQISTGLEVLPANLTTNAGFTISHPLVAGGAPRTYNPEGQYQPTP